MEEHLLTLPVGGEVERTAIGACIVVGLADIGRIVLESGTPGVAHVLIGLVAITVKLEESWNGEIHPLGIVVLQRKKVLGSILMVLHKVKLPHAFHREEACRGRLVALGLVDVLEGKEVGTTGFTILLVDVRIFPHRCLIGSSH